jgi:hypothetical protein
VPLAWQPHDFGVPPNDTEVRKALSVVQPDAAKLMAGSTGDKLQAHIISTAVTLLEQKLCYLKRETDSSGLSLSRAEQAVKNATAGAADALLFAANGHNSKPGLAWESFPAVLQAPLFDLFHQQGWITSLGLPVMQQQLPYSLPMDLQQYNAFICNPENKFFIAWWTEHYWFPVTTPTPAAYPWLHTRRLQLALTQDWVFTLAARLPAFWPVLKPAVAAGILPQQLLQVAHEAANQQPLSTAQLFIRRWVQQASAVVGIAALQLHSRADSLKAHAHKAAAVVPAVPLYMFTESWGSGSGGRSHGALTAVGAGDEGSRAGRAAPVMLYNESKKAVGVVRAVEGCTGAEQGMDAARVWPASKVLHSRRVKARR